tara:strand:+ start:276 stop:1244 length:969 start_codon:yes stop_codon:yes gene_type:complete
MKVFLSTCDKTNHILNTTIYLWNKFTYNLFDIYILGFNKPDNLSEYENVTFVKLADRQESVNLWSKYIYNYLKDITDEYIIFAMDDELPIDYLNQNMLEKTLEIMKINKHYGLCNIGNTIYTNDVNNHLVIHHPSQIYYLIFRNNFKIIYQNEHFNLWERHKNEYKINGQPGLWKTEYLLKQLKNNITPWEFELVNSRNAINDGYTVIHSSSCPGINLNNNTKSNIIEYEKYKPILNFANETALTGSRGVTNKVNVLGLKYEYIEELINLKYLKSEDLIFGLCKTCHIEYLKNTKNFKRYIHNIKSCCNKKSAVIRFNSFYK